MPEDTDVVCLRVGKVVGVEMLHNGDGKPVGSRVVLDFEPGVSQKSRSDAVIGFPLTVEQGELLHLGQSVSVSLEVMK